MTEREKFEQWAKGQCLVLIGDDEEYDQETTQGAWEGWQARQPEIDALKAENEELRNAAREIIKIWDGEGRTDMYGRIIDKLRPAMTPDTKGE